MKSMSEVFNLRVQECSRPKLNFMKTVYRRTYGSPSTIAYIVIYILVKCYLKTSKFIKILNKNCR